MNRKKIKDSFDSIKLNNNQKQEILENVIREHNKKRAFKGFYVYVSAAAAMMIIATLSFVLSYNPVSKNNANITDVALNEEKTHSDYACVLENDEINEPATDEEVTLTLPGVQTYREEADTVYHYSEEKQTVQSGLSDDVKNDVFADKVVLKHEKTDVDLKGEPETEGEEVIDIIVHATTAPIPEDTEDNTEDMMVAGNPEIINNSSIPSPSGGAGGGGAGGAGALPLPGGNRGGGGGMPVTPEPTNTPEPTATPEVNE